MAEWDDWIGREEMRHDHVTQAAIDRFCATFNLPSDDTAPPGFHWCLCTPDEPTRGLGPDGHPEKGDFLPPTPLPRRMWAGSEVEFHVPIRAGATIEKRSKIADIAEKQGSSGELLFVTLDHRILADGALAIEERQSLVYRKAASGPYDRSTARMTSTHGWLGRRSLTPDEALLFRYSALTFNSHRIHYDLPYARDVEGYPALVVHGPLTATLLLHLSLGYGADAPLKNFKVTAQAPAFCGEPLHLAEWDEVGHRILLIAVSEDGREIMKGEMARGKRRT